MEKVKLKDIAKVVIGISAPKKFITLNDKNAVPFIRAGALEDLCNNKNNIDEFLDKDKFKSVPRSTVIFAKSGMSALKNRVYSLKEESVIVGHLAGVICNEDKINHRFLEYYLKCNKPSSLNQNDSYPSIRTEDIENIVIELPKLEQQIKTVNKLDKIQEVINIRKKQIEELDKLIKSQFVEMFENEKYPKKSLIDVCEELFAGGDVNKEHTSKERTDKYKYPIYTNGEKLDGLYGYTDIVRVNKEAVTISGRGTIGFSCIRKEPFYPAVRLIVAVPNKNIIETTFLRQFIENKNYGGQGASIPQLTVPMIKNELIPIPPIELQNQFSEFVKLIDKQKFELQNSLEEMKKLQESLMNKYFG